VDGRFGLPQQGDRAAEVANLLDMPEARHRRGVGGWWRGGK
jgi:hypothetical protein